MMSAAARFLDWGQRIWGTDRRIPFKPILLLFLWSAAVRITVSDSLPPIRFREFLTPYGETAWLVTALICPPMALVAGGLLSRCPWSKAALVGLWVRLSADVGQLAVIITFHVVNIMTATGPMREDTIYERYLIASVMAFLAAVIVRDMWALIMTERVAYGIRRET